MSRWRHLEISFAIVTTFVIVALLILMGWALLGRPF
jgi:hypothetical protein